VRKGIQAQIISRQVEAIDLSHSLLMKKISEEKAIKLLKKYAPDNNAFSGVLQHSKSVQKVALDIGKKIKDVDLDFIKSASLLHDIGRFQVGPGFGGKGIKHGIFGAEILRKEGLERHALVAERHLGAGISKEDIGEQGLELPLNDYIPISKEEKIIAHADNLVFGDRKGTVEEAVDRFSEELGKKVGRKVKKLAREVEGMEG